MRNRWLINLLLLLLVMVLAAAMRRDLEQDHRVVTLTGMRPTDITEILLERPRALAIHLVQETDGWRMREPYRVAAAEARIDELVRIASTQVHRSLPAGADVRRLGLGKDSPRLTLNGLELRFGDVDPIAQHRYVAVGEQVHLIGDGFQHHLIARPEDYIDHALLPTGFQPGSGTLDSVPLTARELAQIARIKAQDIEPLGQELVGRLLSLDSEDGKQSLRFLVSADGRGWARLDLRLRYLVVEPPVWAIAQIPPMAPAPAGGEPTPGAPY